MAATVLEALRRFLPAFLETAPALSSAQQRAIRAITQCRTAALGGRVYDCARCAQTHFAFHSCNHKACPQCGRAATRQWVARQLQKRVNAPYFLLTFTLPSELRAAFFGPWAREAYDLFFGAVAGALSEKLATDKNLRADVHGFIAVLHTWTQRLEFHPHIHCLVPGAGLDRRALPVRVKRPDFLIYLPHLQAAFRQHLRRLLEQKGWQADPGVWTRDWGVHIQPAGHGAAALKYLGAYVARTALSDGRMVAVDEHSVTFRWKDRDHHLWRTQRLTGHEFMRRYLRHVLPVGLRSIRYYGFCHPAAKARRLRVQMHTGRRVDLGAVLTRPEEISVPCCPRCGGPLRCIGKLRRFETARGPPLDRVGTFSRRASLFAA